MSIRHDFEFCNRPNYIAKRCKTSFDLSLICPIENQNLKGFNLTVKKALFLKYPLSTNPHPVKHIFSPNSSPFCHSLERNKLWKVKIFLY